MIRKFQSHGLNKTAVRTDALVTETRYLLRCIPLLKPRDIEPMMDKIKDLISDGECSDETKTKLISIANIIDGN